MSAQSTSLATAQSDVGRSWILRPIVWFAGASMVTTILHEGAHAFAALALGVPSTLFNYSANLDLTPTQAASHAPVLIRLAGPLFCLAFGTLSLFGFNRARRASQSAFALPLLYLSVFSLGTFSGNLMSTAFVGDFSAAAVALGLPMIVRYVIAVAGALAVAALHFWAGRELVQWVPAHIGRVAGMLGIIALPVALGTTAVILINQPMPRAWVNPRIAETGFWLFAAVGVLTTRREFRELRASPAPRWADGAMILLAIVAVRLMVGGIRFTP
jgi:hypothetical protein